MWWSWLRCARPRPTRAGRHGEPFVKHSAARLQRVDRAGYRVPRTPRPSRVVARECSRIARCARPARPARAWPVLPQSGSRTARAARARAVRSAQVVLALARLPHPLGASLESAWRMNLIHASLCPPAHMVAERLPQCGSFRKVAHAKECGIPAECTALCRAPRMTSPRRTLTHLHESALSLEGTPAPLGCRSSRPGRHFASTQWPPEPFRKCPALNAWTSDPGRKAFRLNSVAEAPVAEGIPPRLGGLPTRSGSAQRSTRGLRTLAGRHFASTTCTRNPSGEASRLDDVHQKSLREGLSAQLGCQNSFPEGISPQLG